MNQTYSLLIVYCPICTEQVITMQVKLSLIHIYTYSSLATKTLHKKVASVWSLWVTVSCSVVCLSWTTHVSPMHALAMKPFVWLKAWSPCECSVILCPAVVHSRSRADCRVMLSTCCVIRMPPNEVHGTVYIQGSQSSNQGGCVLWTRTNRETSQQNDWQAL